MLDAGPAAWGWKDQCWTLARIGELVRERFGVDYTLAGLDVLLHRMGWSVQVPARREVLLAGTGRRDGMARDQRRGACSFARWTGWSSPSWKACQPAGCWRWWPTTAW